MDDWKANDPMPLDQFMKLKKVGDAVRSAKLNNVVHASSFHLTARTGSTAMNSSTTMRTERGWVANQPQHGWSHQVSTLLSGICLLPGLLRLILRTQPRSVYFASLPKSVFLAVLFTFTAFASALDIPATQIAAEKGDADAQFQLGRAYFRGDGVAQDDTKAFELFQKAAEQGNAKAQHNLASMYLDGRGVTKDETEAVKWYRKSAEQGTALAQSTLGSMLAAGKGVKKDCKEAAQWLEKAAAQGDANARLQLGELYYFGGENFPNDDKQAARWLVLAAEDGSARAQNLMGILYEEDRGVEENPKEAAKWFLKAAEQGHVKAQSNIGRLYSTGYGVEQNPVTACKWLMIASAQKEITAINLLDDYQKGLSQVEIAEGQRLAREFLAKAK